MVNITSDRKVIDNFLSTSVCGPSKLTSAILEADIKFTTARSAGGNFSADKIARVSLLGPQTRVLKKKR
jgi:hypothetical protein